MHHEDKNPVCVRYGPAPKNSDSAINILLDVVQDQSGKKYKMDHYATRYPTNVLDIASFLVKLIGTPVTPLLICDFSKHIDPPSALSNTAIPRILHFSAPEPFTKYEICLIYALILGLPHSHIIPDDQPPSGAAAAARPKDCQLDTSETEKVLKEGVGEEGVESGLGCVLFEEWWRRWLGVVKGGSS